MNNKEAMWLCAELFFFILICVILEVEFCNYHHIKIIRFLRHVSVHPLIVVSGRLIFKDHGLVVASCYL